MNLYHQAVSEMSLPQKKFLWRELQNKIQKQKGQENQQLLAFVETNNDKSIETLKDVLKKELPSYMIPQKIFAIKSLNRLPNGKVDKKGLMGQVELGKSPSLSNPSMSNNTNLAEAIIIEIWEEILKTSGVEPTDNFFELGGHSILATFLVAKISETFQTDIKVQDVFENPTIQSFVAKLYSNPESKKAIEETLALL